MCEHEIANISLARMRVMLGGECREELWWGSLIRRERIGLLRLADINISYHNKEWTELAPVLRKRIIDIALKASHWVRELTYCFEEVQDEHLGV